VHHVACAEFHDDFDGSRLQLEHIKRERAARTTTTKDVIAA
jgi:hypothetical protein